MSTLSYLEIVKVWTKNGGSVGLAPTMAAIALAESGGNPRAYNGTPPDKSYGLWQINMIGDLGPARRKEFGISSNEELFDPDVNAKAAIKISRGQGLKAWSTYTNGAYKKKLDSAEGSVFNPDTPKSGLRKVTDALNTNPAEALQQKFDNVADKALNVLVSLARNYVMLAGGAILVLVGVVILLRRPVGVVANAVPAGKVAKAAQLAKVVSK